MGYDERGEEVETVCVALWMLCDEEVADDNTNKDDEDLDEGDVEIADHV